MGAKVFISCGQSGKKEIEIAIKIKEWLKNQGYEAYLAIKEQELKDLNSSIINNLEDSDYFLFIDFKRERCRGVFTKGEKHRGSLFSHQELALAYYLGFENVIFLKQKEVMREGFVSYIQGNPVLFSTYEELLAKIQKEVVDKWNPNYSRGLMVEFDSIGKPVSCEYSDRLGKRREYIWGCRIENRRKKDSAKNVVVTLQRIKYPNGIVKDSPDKAQLKWGGTPSYTLNIANQNYSNIDLFGIPLDEPTKIYLHSCIDIFPRKPIIESTGTYFLYYKVSAERFPILIFSVRLHLTNDLQTTEVRIGEQKTTLPNIICQEPKSEMANQEITKEMTSGIDVFLKWD